MIQKSQVKRLKQAYFELCLLNHLPLYLAMHHLYFIRIQNRIKYYKNLLIGFKSQIFVIGAR